MSLSQNDMGRAFEYGIVVAMSNIIPAEIMETFRNFIVEVGPGSDFDEARLDASYKIGKNYSHQLAREITEKN